jgi:hypothetical protein
VNPVAWFINERGNACEICGCEQTYNNPFQRHHCLHGRVKNHPEFDEPVNIELVCFKCHFGCIADSFEHRQEFAMRQINRGYDVKLWYESLNLKAPEAWLLEL